MEVFLAAEVKKKSEHMQLWCATYTFPCLIMWNFTLSKNHNFSHFRIELLSSIRLGTKLKLQRRPTLNRSNSFVRDATDRQMDLEIKWD